MSPDLVAPGQVHEVPREGCSTPAASGVPDTAVRRLTAPVGQLH